MKKGEMVKITDRVTGKTVLIGQFVGTQKNKTGEVQWIVRPVVRNLSYKLKKGKEYDALQHKPRKKKRA